MYFLEWDDFAIAGASPEPLVKVSGRRAEVRPIAGTRPRAASPEEDLRVADELLRDEKERAEHVMLVDLGRNDLGRVCEFGTRRGRRADERRDLLARDAHRLVGDRHAAARDRRDGCAARGAARGHALRRAEDPGDGDHRRARAGEARLLRRRDRLSELHRRPRHLHPHPHGRGQGRRRIPAGRRGRGGRLGPRVRVPRNAREGGRDVRCDGAGVPSRRIGQ